MDGSTYEGRTWEFLLGMTRMNLLGIWGSTLYSRVVPKQLENGSRMNSFHFTTMDVGRYTGILNLGLLLYRD